MSNHASTRVEADPDREHPLFLASLVFHDFSNSRTTIYDRIYRADFTSNFFTKVVCSINRKFMKKMMKIYIEKKFCCKNIFYFQLLFHSFTLTIIQHGQSNFLFIAITPLRRRTFSVYI